MFRPQLHFCWSERGPRNCFHATFQTTEQAEHLHSPLCGRCSQSPGLIRCVSESLTLCAACFLEPSIECIRLKHQVSVNRFGCHLTCVDPSLPVDEIAAPDFDTLFQLVGTPLPQTGNTPAAQNLTLPPHGTGSSFPPPPGFSGSWIQGSSSRVVPQGFVEYSPLITNVAAPLVGIGQVQPLVGDGDGVEVVQQHVGDGDGVEVMQQQVGDGDGVEVVQQQFGDGDGVEVVQQQVGDGDGVDVEHDVGDLNLELSLGPANKRQRR